VTANIYFTRIVKIRKQIRQWSTCGNPLVEEISANTIDKFDKYWSDIQGLIAIATILDPRCKTIVLLINYEDLLGVQGRQCEDKVLEVRDLLAELMSEYHVVEDVEGSTKASSPSMVDNDDFLSDIGAHITSFRPASMGFKSELHHYLDE
jgi:hypothetical protein